MKIVNRNTQLSIEPNVDVCEWAQVSGHSRLHHSEFVFLLLSRCEKKYNQISKSKNPSVHTNTLWPPVGVTTRDINYRSITHIQYLHLVHTISAHSEWWSQISPAKVGDQEIFQWSHWLSWRKACTACAHFPTYLGKTHAIYQAGCHNNFAIMLCIMPFFLCNWETCQRFFLYLSSEIN